MNDWNDNTVMPWGKHQGVQLKDIPDSYLHFMWQKYESGEYETHEKFKNYLDENIDAIKANLARNS